MAAGNASCSMSANSQATDSPPMTDISSSHQEIQALVEELQARYALIDDGEVATYIPELSKANPDEFGVSLVTASGRLFESGHCDRLSPSSRSRSRSCSEWRSRSVARNRCSSGSTSNRAETRSMRSSCRG